MKVAIKKRPTNAEPEGHWAPFLDDAFDRRFDVMVANAEKGLGRPLMPIERHRMAHAALDTNAPPTDAQVKQRLMAKAVVFVRGVLAKSHHPATKRKVHGKVGPVRAYDDKVIKKPNATHQAQMKDSKAPPVKNPSSKTADPHGRKPLPSEWRGTHRVAVTPEQVALAKEKYGIALPPGKTGEDGQPTQHGHVVYDPPLVTKKGKQVAAQYFDSAGRRQDLYAPGEKEKSQEQKYCNLKVFLKALPKIRKEIAAQLDTGGTTKERANACVLTVIDQTAIRIGSEGNATRDEKPTFGAASLRKEHVKVSGAVAHITFVGKKGKVNTAIVRGAAIVDAIKDFMRLPGDRLWQYEDANGVPQPFTARAVNDYLDKYNVTPKQWRTYQATKMFRAILAQMPKAEGEKERKKVVNLVADKVAVHLNNTRVMCLNEYIDPAAIGDYMRG